MQKLPPVIWLDGQFRKLGICTQAISAFANLFFLCGCVNILLPLPPVSPRTRIITRNTSTDCGIHLPVLPSRGVRTVAISGCQLGRAWGGRPAVRVTMSLRSLGRSCGCGHTRTLPTHLQPVNKVIDTVP